MPHVSRCFVYNFALCARLVTSVLRWRRLFCCLRVAQAVVMCL